METTDDLLKQLIRELQTLTGGLKMDFAYRRQTRFQALESKKLTVTTAPAFVEFSEPITELTLVVTNMGTATTVYVEPEGTAGTDSVELNAVVRVLSFGSIPIKKLSFMADAGSTTKVQVFGLRGG